MVTAGVKWLTTTHGTTDQPTRLHRKKNISTNTKFTYTSIALGKDSTLI